MAILAKVKNTKYEFICNSYEDWNEISENCSLLEKVFPEKIYPEMQDVVSKVEPLKYEIKFSDKKLRQLTSEIDKFRNTLVFDDVKYKLLSRLKELIHKSMSKKKNSEVKCLWIKD